MVLIGVFLLILVLTGACATGFMVGRESAVTATSLATEQVDAPPGNDAQVGVEEQVEIEALEPTATVRPPYTASTRREREELFEAFWQTWDAIHDRYVDQPVDDITLMRGAIAGMLESLGDEHTTYLDPDLQKAFNARLNGEEYEGIGAWVDIQGEYLTIISPMPGSPAEKAGIKPGDEIIAVDGEDMTGIDGELVLKRVKGPAGTTVVLTIRRAEVEELFDVTVERRVILTPTVEYRLLEENNLAYLRLLTFGSDTSEQVRDALKEMLAQNPDGLILDLRYNGGGYLPTAIEIVSEFIPDGVVMIEEYGDGSQKTFESLGNGVATKIPLVVLVNEGSASASEIVAGAIQDLGRGKLVGMTSFGKGSVQNVLPLVNDQGQIRVTTARWLTPNGRQINKIGLEPDFTVEISEDDFNAGIDPQLDKAIELLSRQ
jgi:carboxyl-terminal processing protease